MSRDSKLVGVALAVVAAIVGLGTMVGLDEYRGKQIDSQEPAGKYLSTTLNGAESSAGTGFGISQGGQVVVGGISTGPDLYSFVRTDVRTVMVEGAFTAPLGDALQFVRLKNGIRYLCPSDRHECREVADLEY